MSCGYICPQCGNVSRREKEPNGLLCIGTKDGVIDFNHGTVLMDFYDPLPEPKPAKPEIDYLGAARAVSGR